MIKDTHGRFLLIQRKKAPNKNCWSPIGGKLEREIGESPYECAVREVKEEINLDINIPDLHLYSMVAESGYEGMGHWLMFVFDCKVPIKALPEEIDEGSFGFFTREEVEKLALPETDRTLLWPYYDSHSSKFIALRADCSPDSPLTVKVEEEM